ncbi:MAG: hypothetical protein KAR06_03085, partial [Deltaproteobacteria bacterium]|nr:hypothetical protein [Deltaproteobacteria bacterium]
MTIDHLNILIELNKAVKTLNFYPKGHPNLDSVITQCYTMLREGLNTSSEIKWTVEKKVLIADGVPLSPENQIVESFTKNLFLRKAKVIIFTQSLTPEDLIAFMKIITMDPESIFALGGVEKAFVKQGGRGILLNEMTFEQISELEQEDEDLKVEEEEEVEEEGAAEEEEELPEQDENEEQKELFEAISELLIKLNAAKDILEYNDTSARIMEQALPLLAEENYQQLFPVLYTYCGHS